LWNCRPCHVRPASCATRTAAATASASDVDGLSGAFGTSGLGVDRLGRGSGRVAPARM
ncbi:Ubiquitin homeostasis protein lub1, partial [Durusdinium trenchii]